MNRDQLIKLGNVFTSVKHRENFIKNTGMMYLEANLNKFNEIFNVEKCYVVLKWSDEDFKQFDDLITECVVQRWVWPITLRAVNGSMALGEERVSITGSHLL